MTFPSRCKCSVQKTRREIHSNLSVTAPASKGLPEAVLNDRRDPLHAEALRRTEVKWRNTTERYSV